MKFLIVMFATLVSACANFNTIARTTHLGLAGEQGTGRAIHLDIQQRLAFVNGEGNICSEPSPDALAAYAAAFGLGASAPTKGSVTADLSTSSAVASVGVRTQSITLMRDALYRMCEAYSNGQMSPAQVMTFLSRSQDLTAVVLAVEQLTGPVVGQQASLTGEARAQSSASVASASTLAENERSFLESLRAKREKQTKERAELDGAQKAIQRDIDAKQTELTAANNPPAGQSVDAQAVKTLEDELRELRKQDDKLSSQLDAADANIAATDEQIQASETRLASLQANEDEAFAQTITSAQTEGEFSDPAANRTNTDPKLVASSVASIVKEVLRKDYVVEGCMSIILLPTSDQVKLKAFDSASFNQTRDKCFQLLEATAQSKIARVAQEPTRDELTACIKVWFNSHPDNKAKSVAWLTRNSVSSLRNVLDGTPALRKKFVKDNSIECT